MTIDFDDIGEREGVKIPINFMSFGSGSSGNSCYVGTRNGGIIIDAGVRADVIREALRNNGVDMGSVKGLLLTHDHSDHVRYAYTLLRENRHLSVYCTHRVMNAILRRHGISKKIKDYHIPVFKEIPFSVAGFEITAFEVNHDATCNSGFHLVSPSGIRFALATDMGSVTDRARYYLSRADYMMIEANYDSDMLRLGRYPEYLKARIRTDHGHMDNRQTAEFLSSLDLSSVRHIFLCHLSKDNNTPEKALTAIRGALEAKGLRVGEGNETIADRECDIQLQALPRYEATRWYVLR